MQQSNEKERLVKAIFRLMEWGSQTHPTLSLRNSAMQSILGTFLDPLADKVLVAVLALPLAYKGTYASPSL